MQVSGPVGVERGLRTLGQLQHEEEDNGGRSLGVEVSIFGHPFDVFLNSATTSCMLSFDGCEKYAGFTARTFLPMKSITVDLREHPIYGISRRARLLVRTMSKHHSM
jgi:hypothetical protein